MIRMLVRRLRLDLRRVYTVSFGDTLGVLRSVTLGADPSGNPG